MNFSRTLSFALFLFLMSCSASYKQVRDINTENPKTFQEHLLNNYKLKASFEAEEMHDWNSAKLYSEKALKARKGENIYPEKISYWKIPSDKISYIKLGYNDLLSIYNQAILVDPKNLAKAISSLDCWSEQEEEKWQTWDIENCKNDFHSAMHEIYNKISTQNKENITKEKIIENVKSESNVTIVTQNNQKEVIQIIYFDFDNFILSDVSKNTLINFLRKNKSDISRFIILGHTDTKGTKDYNLTLSLKRAGVVKQILMDEGISENNISVLGKGENQLAVKTPDEIKHPANRRAEIKIVN